MTVLLGPADADHFRVKVGRYGDRWYADPLAADEIAPATDAAWPSVSTVKKASGSDWSFVALKRVAQTLEAKPAALQGLQFDERYDRLKSINNSGLKQAAGRGTNVHTYFERGLRGQPIVATLPGESGEEYLPAVRSFFDAYQPELVAAELVCVNRSLHGVGYGGTGDAIIRIDGRLYFVDWKSRGEDSSHGAYPDEGAQIAGYGSAEYMIVQGPNGPERQKLPDLDGGLIVSIKPDGYRVYPVDLAQATTHFEALHAWWVARRSEREAIGKPWAPKSPTGVTSAPLSPSPAPVEPVDVASVETFAPGSERYDWLRGRVADLAANAPALGALAAAWPAGTPTLKSLQPLTSEQIDALAALVTRVEADHALPFPAADPAALAAKEATKPAVEERATVVALRPAPGPEDEGGALDDEATMVALSRRIEALSAEQRAQLAAWVTEASRAGVPFLFSTQRTKRRFSIYLAVADALSFDADADAMIRAALACVIGDDTMQTHPTGALLGTLTPAEATSLGEILADIAGAGAGQFSVRFDDDGTLRITAA